MTARSTFEAVHPLANVALVAANQSAEATYNSAYAAALATYNAAGPSGFAAFDSSIKSAQRALVAAKLKAAHDAQQTIQAAKDTLRSTGDFAPA
jgi:hypothetical protein